MKKKMLISLVACFIAAGSFIGYNFSENNHNMDISLADISVMAKAGEEDDNDCSRSCFDSYCNPVWEAKNCKVSCGTKTCTFSYAEKL